MLSRIDTYIKFSAVFLSLFIISLSSSYGQRPTRQVIARQLIEKAINAMGRGWDTVKTISFEGYGYQNQIDQSERSEGPYIPIQLQRNILKDLSHNAFRVIQTTQSYTSAGNDTTLFNAEAIAVKANGTLMAVQTGQELSSELNISPEVVLKKALNSPTLGYLKDTIFQKTGHSIVIFKDNIYPVRLFLNKETALISAVEITRPFNDDFSGIWGDIKKTVIYSFWMLVNKGLHYPLQQDCYLNDYYKTSFLINKWKINPPVPAGLLQIPANIKDQAQLLTKSQEDSYNRMISKNTKEIAPGVWFIGGFCNTTVVNQPDGIVVIESAISSFYAGLIISKVHALFPGKKIKALISTSDAWLHIGGVRSFAALPAITIYHPAHNRQLLKKLLKAPFTTAPDALAKTIKPSYTLNGVTDTLTIGNGNNRLVMYAYKTETGDRQMMVYFPQHKLLYASDLYQGKYNGDYWNKQIVWEAYHSVKSRKIDVKQFYAMHSKTLLDFKDLEKDVTEVME